MSATALVVNNLLFLAIGESACTASYAEGCGAYMKEGT